MIFCSIESQHDLVILPSIVNYYLSYEGAFADKLVFPPAYKKVRAMRVGTTKIMKFFGLDVWSLGFLGTQGTQVF
jgi:hypothetical protein